MIACADPGLSHAAEIIAPALSALVFAYVAVINRKVNASALATEAVHAEVKTMNAQTIGELIDAAETRRIDEIEPDDRTRAEAQHLGAVPMPPAEE